VSHGGMRGIGAPQRTPRFVGEYEGVVRVSRRVFQSLLSDAPTPERCLEAYHLHRTRFELIAERKVRRRQLTDDGNVEITGRDLREWEFRARRPIGYRRAASREPHNKPFGMPSAGSLSGRGSRFRLRASAVASIRSSHGSMLIVVPIAGPRRHQAREAS
jgi:hypothetical protein